MKMKLPQSISSYSKYRSIGTCLDPLGFPDLELGSIFVGFALLLCALLAACGSTADGSDNDKGTENDVTDTGEISHCEPMDTDLVEADAEALFHSSTIPNFDLYLPPDAWADLQINARDEEYIPAEACFEGHSLGKVGLRFKGSLGSLYYCFDENDNQTCRKLSIKLKFSEYDEENRLYGLKRLNFQAYKDDDTYMKERLTYDMYRAMDIVTPRAAWATLRVNDEPIGLFGMVEQVDGRFTEDRFPEEQNGNLYKELWPVFTDETWIRSKLKTNEETADFSGYLGFVDAVANAEDADLEETVGRFMDLDYMARYMAVDDAVNNVDGITGYYASPSLDWSGNHNFYLYEEAPEKFTLIPWDEDSAFTMRLGFGSVPHWTKTPEACDRLYPAWNAVHSVIASGCDPIFKAEAQHGDAYRAAVDTLLDGPFAEKALGDTVDEYEALIRDAVSEDPHGPGIEGFDVAVSRLREDIPLLRKRLERLVTEPEAPILNLAVDRVEDFENLDDIEVWMGTEIMYGSNTAAFPSLDRDDPIQGTQSLKYSFDYGNGDKAWQQWAYIHIPFRGGYQDVSRLAGIRMKVRADKGRTLRLNLTSPNETALMSGVAFGWDIPVTSDVKDVEVLFEDTKFPTWAARPDDALEDTLSTLGGLSYQPSCSGVGSNGFLPKGTRDVGFFEIDDIEFF